MARPRGSVNRRATRERILAVAERAFAKGGFHGTLLHEVAAESGMRAPSLLYHFESKEDLFDEVVRRAYRRIEPPLLSALASADSPRELLASVLEAISSFEAEHRDLLGVLNAEVLGSGRHGLGAVRDTMLPLVERIESAVRDASGARMPADVPLRQALLHVIVMHAVRANLGEIAPEILGSVDEERALAAALLELVVSWPERGPSPHAA